MFDDSRATIVGFAGALLVLGALVWFVGVDEVISALTDADPTILALILVVAVVWVSAWGLALWVVLRALDTSVRPHVAIALFTGAMFANNITPFGQAGGEPVSALLISRRTGSEYETGLAAIASVDALHFVPTMMYAVVGLTFVLLDRATIGRNLLFAAGATLALAILIPMAGLLGWRYRYRLEGVFVRVFTPIVRFIGDLLPGRRALSAEAIETRIEHFFGALERVATDTGTLALAVACSAFGWLALATCLWLSVAAVGGDVPFAAVLLVLPIASIAGVTPFPGGSGAVESVMAVLLVAASPVTFPVATSAAFVHRGITYVLPTFVGGAIASYMGASSAITE